MKLFFNKKTAIFCLLIMLLVAALSCGQLSLDNHDGFLGSEVSECGTITSAISTFSSKESLMLIGTLLLLVVFSVFAQRLPWQGKTYTLDPPEQIVTFISNRMNVILNQIQEAFRKGVLHSQTYSSTTASG